MESPAQSAARMSKMDKGPITYPPDHKLGMKVTRGGSMCKNCEYVTGKNCANKYWIKWHGNTVIPEPIDEYCCDLWEPAD